MRVGGTVLSVSLLWMACAVVAQARPIAGHASRRATSQIGCLRAAGDFTAKLHRVCYEPSQIETAYNMQALYAQGYEGQGQTVVIVDSFGSPTISHDVKVFDAQFHLPAPPSFRVMQPVGSVGRAEARNPRRFEWAGETSLDVEWAHVMAPKANILLVETPEAETQGAKGFRKIVAAENFVIDHNLGEVISQSFGTAEQTFASRSSLLALRSAYKNAATHDVTVLAGSGDHGVANENLAETGVIPGRTVDWPASDPLVTAVGGTELHLNEAGERTAPDSAFDQNEFGQTWAVGGGESSVFALPAYQQLVRTVPGTRRAVPDISMNAAFRGGGGVPVYGSYLSPREPGWTFGGGTSEASPLFAGVVAIADQIAGHPLGLINPRMYALANAGASDGIVDVTSGDNTYAELNRRRHRLLKVRGYDAAPGYDLVTGLGTVEAFAFAHALAER